MNPELAKEWNYEKNTPLTPDDVSGRSPARVWWKCTKGHEWEAKISSRATNKSGCPYCSGRYPIKGEIDLATLRPDLAKEWNYEKNGVLTPDTVVLGSNKKVWWKCSNRHEWEAVISSRSMGRGCPICSGNKVLTGYNDLLTTHPLLAKEWDYDKNKDLNPADVTAGSGKKVWWKCSNGHVWQSRISHRSKDHGCPFCSGRNAIKGENDFATLYPELISEWNYEKNGEIDPSDFTKRSGQKVWWKCSQGHEWVASIHNRTGGHGCPYCAGLKAIPGTNDFATLYPDLVLEWDFEKNGDLSPSECTAFSGQKVWWKCNKGHEWETTIISRANGSECPRCQYIGTSKPEQGIAFYLNQCCKIEPRAMINNQEIDIFLPEYDIGIEYDGRFFHKEKEEKEKKKETDVSSVGITLFRIKESDRNCIEGNVIHFVTDYLGPNYVWAIRSLFNIIAELTENTDISKIDIDTDRDRLKIRERYSLIAKENSLLIKYPELAKEWDYEKNGILSPDMFFSGSVEKVWWKCSKGHEWESVIYSRVDGSGCPYCSGRFAFPGETDLATLRPELIKEWNYNKNGELSPSTLTVSSGKKVWWKCDKGHEWQTTPRDRSRGSGCPFCSGKSVLPGFNDLESLDPELAKEWSYEKNTLLKPSDVTLNSGKKVWWKCDKGHEWESIIANRSSHKRGCPYCAGKKALLGFNDLTTTNPELITEWNFEKNNDLKPSDFTRGSGKKVWWKCSKGHEWEAIIANRTINGRGCPYCAKQRALYGINDL